MPDTTNMPAALHRDFLGDRTDNWEQWVQYLTVAVHTAVELGELGEPLETAVAEMARLGITPRRVWVPQRYMWVYLAYGRLAQAHAAPADQRAARLVAAHAAVDTVRRFARPPGYRAHHRVLTAM